MNVTPRFFTALVTQYVCFCAGRRVTCLRSPHPRLHRKNTCRWGQRFSLLAAPFTGARAMCSAGMTSEYMIAFGYCSSSWFIGSCHHIQYACSVILLMNGMKALIVLQFLFYWYKCVLHKEVYRKHNLKNCKVFYVTRSSYYICVNSCMFSKYVVLVLVIVLIVLTGLHLYIFFQIF